MADDRTLEELRASNPPAAVTGAELIYAVQGGAATALTIDEVAAAVGGIVAGGTYAQPHRGAHVSLSADTATGALPFLVPWDNVLYDTDGCWSPGAPTRLTVPVGVTRARLRAFVTLDSGNDLYGYSVAVAKNGDRDYAGMPFSNLRTNPTDGTKNYANNVASICSAPLAVTAGDYFEVRVNAASGTDYTEVQESRSSFSLEVLEAVASP